MNDVNNRIFKEFTEFFDNVEKSASEISVTMAYEITMKSTISTAIIVLESEGRLEERYWNHLIYEAWCERVGSISPAMIQLCANERCTDQICMAASRLRLFPVIGWN